MKNFPSSKMLSVYTVDMDDKNINIMFIDRDRSIQEEKE